MKTLIMTIISFVVFVTPCFAGSFTVVANEPPVVTFLYNDEIHVSGDLYQFYTINRNTEMETNVVLCVIANKRTHEYVLAGGMVELPGGVRKSTQGDSKVYIYQNGSIVDKIIKMIDGRTI